MNIEQSDYKEVGKIAKSLGLLPSTLRDGVFISAKGMTIDLTATASDRLSVLAKVGQTYLIN